MESVTAASVALPPTHDIRSGDPEHDTGGGLFPSYCAILVAKSSFASSLTLFRALRPAASTARCWRVRLVYDLPIEPQRNLWLRNADVTVLLAPERAPEPGANFSCYRSSGQGMRYGMLPADSAEVRSKLSLFLRSRWFKPP